LERGQQILLWYSRIAIAALVRQTFTLAVGVGSLVGAGSGGAAASPITVGV